MEREPRLSDSDFAEVLYDLWLPELDTLGENHPLSLFFFEVRRPQADPFRLGDLLKPTWEFVCAYAARAAGPKRATAVLTLHFLERLDHHAITTEQAEREGLRRPSPN